MRLHYIGKSNKKFTHGKIYQGSGNYGFDWIAVTIIDNSGSPYYYGPEYNQYFVDNFDTLSEEEYKKLIRKNKLNKISKI